MGLISRRVKSNGLILSSWLLSFAFWYWFILERLLWKSFWMYLFCLVFVVFWYFFYFVKFVLWRSLLFWTHSSWGFHECLACNLPSFEYHFNSLFLTFITGVCSEINCSFVSRFVENSYLTFMAIQLTGCHTWWGI